MSRWLLVITLTLSLGAHWAFLQSLAWAGMIVSYSSDAPIAEAVSKTFDGEHPCGLCKFVERAKNSEQKQETIKAEKKIDKVFTAEQLVLISSPELKPMVFHTVPDPASRVETPPLPPPRVDCA